MMTSRFFCRLYNVLQLEMDLQPHGVGTAETRNVSGATSPNSSETRKTRTPYYVTDEKQCFLVNNIDDGDFEHAPVDQLEVWTIFDPLAAGVGELERSWVHVEPNASKEQQHLISYTTQALVTEVGLDAQDYKCAGCGGPLGIIFGEAHVCHFDGKSYCDQCHHGNQAIIPGRVLLNWEFQKRQVCDKCHTFLRQMKSMPVLDISSINGSLYGYVPVLEEVHKLRVQLKELATYLLSCQKLERKFKQGATISPLYKNEHLFSLHELVKVQKGTSLKTLSKAVRDGIRHVLHCSFCSSKGHVCECCHSPKVIYPFDTQKIYKCPNCMSLCHLACFSGKCSKCQI